MYYVLFGVLYAASLLPLKVLYLLSDFAYVVVYYLFGYRNDVVMQNLTIAFPQKTEDEKIKIAKQFYKNFCDTFIETIKFISASSTFFEKRFKADFSVLNEAFALGRPVQIQAGHNFNWELVNLAVPKYLDGTLVGVYLPLNNKIFERLFRYIRSRFGTQLIAATRMREEMFRYRGKHYFIGLIADQAPPVPQKAYWVNFFGRPTAFLRGPENAARISNYSVVFTHFRKSKRGYYEGAAELCTTTPRELPEGHLTLLYAHYLERVMSAHPEMWLWSHRRWKHEWKEEYGIIE
ncbi:MAG: lysophospholipid acyltransferase family protein [Bacteroidota bacterium]|nr:lysophospholipid acyltransferase family protein [Bacteroidota bacterium]